MLSKASVLAIDRAKIWHPFTQMKDYETLDPPVIVKGKGILLEDAEGNTYYDTISSWWTNTLGHCHPRINVAIADQLNQLEHVNFSGFTHPYATELVDKLSHFLPPTLSHHFFSDDGSTSVEVALKMAFQYWQNKGQEAKQKFVMLKNAYHGDTLGAMSVGGVDLYHQLYKPLTFSAHAVDSPHCATCEYRQSRFTLDGHTTGCALECFSAMETFLRAHHHTLAAVIIEPLLQAAGGMCIYGPAYLKQLRALTEELDILLIFDEVATGFGRSGTMFALDQAGVIPDILCLSKGITAGYMPLALTVVKERVYQAFYDDYFSHKTFYHGHSYTANPLACRIAIENLNILQEENLPTAQQAVIAYFHNQLMEQFADTGFVSDIRYLGFVGAIDLVNKKGKPFEAKDRIGFTIYQKSLQNGLVLRPLGDTIYWFLPLIVTQADIETILSRSRRVIQETLDAYP